MKATQFQFKQAFRGCDPLADILESGKVAQKTVGNIQEHELLEVIVVVAK